VEDVVAEEDKVAVRFTLDGTQTGEFMGIPATGRPVVVSANVLMYVSHGRVTNLKANFDQMGLMQQLGVLPAGG
jgi:predicted ester cyclase